MGSLLQSFEDLISTFINQFFGPCIAQRSHKVCAFCTSVSRFSQNLYISFFLFFLRVAKNLKSSKTNAAQVWGKIMLRLKGTKNRVF